MAASAGRDSAFGLDHDSASGYRADLPVAQLIREIGTLRRRQLVLDRLLCRYLADLADRLPASPGALTAGGYQDVFEASAQLLGLGIRATRERVRVGRALRMLPEIERALEGGALSFARAREITRVARAANETTWLELGKTLPIRELERRVADAGRRAAAGTSAHPGGAIPPTAVTPRQDRAESGRDNVRVVLDLSVESWVVLQEALQTVRDRTSASLSDAEAVIALAHDVLRGPCRLTGQEGTAKPKAAPTTDDPAGSPPDRATPADHPTTDDPAGSSPDDATPTEHPATDDPAGSRALASVATRVSSSAPPNDAALLNAATLLRHLRRRPRWNADELCEATGLGPAAVSVALLTLELQGAVRREGWACFAARAA